MGSTGPKRQTLCKSHSPARNVSSPFSGRDRELNKQMFAHMCVCIDGEKRKIKYNKGVEI